MIYYKSSVTKDIADALIAQYGTVSKAAKAIHPSCKTPQGGSVSYNAVRLWVTDGRENRNLAARVPLLAQSPADVAAANKFLKAMHDAGVDTQAVADGKLLLNKGHYRSWGVAAKIKDKKTGQSRLETKSLYSVGFQLSPAWEDGPAWPVIQQAAPVKITYAAPRPRTKGIRVEVWMGDEQIGFLRDPLNPEKMLPMHDEAALDVAEQIIADLQPDRVGHWGDLVDLSEMSRFLQIDEFFRTTQPALDYGYRFLARCEAAAGPRKRRLPTKFLKGNHERRMPEYAQKNARAAFRLRPAMTTPAGWPDLSLERLLRFDELGIECEGEWPGGRHWITDRLVVMHEPPANKADFGASVIFGHRHRQSRESFTRQTQKGEVTNTLYGGGCLCRTDRNPDKSSLMRTRVASDRGYTSWQQGIVVVYIDEASGRHQVDQIDIVNGEATYNRKTYRAAK